MISLINKNNENPFKKIAYKLRDTITGKQQKINIHSLNSTANKLEYSNTTQKISEKLVKTKIEEDSIAVSLERSVSNIRESYLEKYFKENENWSTKKKKLKPNILWKRILKEHL